MPGPNSAPNGNGALVSVAGSTAREALSSKGQLFTGKSAVKRGDVPHARRRNP